MGAQAPRHVGRGRPSDAGADGAAARLAAAELLRRELEGRGIAIFTNGQTEEIAGAERAEAVVLADGRRIETEFVVLAIGIVPNRAGASRGA